MIATGPLLMTVPDTWLEAKNPTLMIVNGLGDYALSLPSVRALCSLFPERLCLVTESIAFHTFFWDLPWRKVCDLVVDHPIDHEYGKAFDVESTVECVGECDGLIVLHPWHNPHMDRLLKRWMPDWSIGFTDSFDLHLEEHAELHAADLTFVVARALRRSLRLEDYSQPLEIAPPFREFAQRLLEVLPQESHLLVVHADTLPVKMYPPSRLRRILERFLARNDKAWALVVGSAVFDWEQAGDGSRILSLCGLPLPVTVTIVKSARLFLGVDSVFLHVADLCRIPGLGLFGPTDPTQWGFRFGPGRTLSGTDDSMENIDEGAILAHLERLYSETIRS